MRHSWGGCTVWADPGTGFPGTGSGEPASVLSWWWILAIRLGARAPLTPPMAPMTELTGIRFLLWFTMTLRNLMLGMKCVLCRCLSCRVPATWELAFLLIRTIFGCLTISRMTLRPPAIVMVGVMNYFPFKAPSIVVVVFGRFLTRVQVVCLVWWFSMTVVTSSLAAKFRGISY